MTEKRSKYDTDPLDPDFVRRTEEVMERTRALDPERTTRPEHDPRRSPVADEPTRRFEDQFNSSYPSVFIPPAYTPPAHGAPRTSFGADAGQQQQHQHQHQQHRPQDANVPPGPASNYDPARPSSRPVAKLGIPENLACILPYAPFYIGIVAAVVELLVVPRTETRTRFHAAQGLALQLVLIAGGLAFNLIQSITGSGLGGKLFWLAGFIFMIISMIRVWEGKSHHIAPLDEPTRWLYEKIEPLVK